MYEFHIDVGQNTVPLNQTMWLKTQLQYINKKLWNKYYQISKYCNTKISYDCICEKLYKVQNWM